MAAPVVTARQTPGGIPLKDGYSTKIACAQDPDIEFFEKTVQPIGMDGGDPISISNMFNVRFHTDVPRTLVRLTNSGLTVAWDPKVKDSILVIMNVNTSWTLHFPDGSTEAFWGWLMSFEPDDHEEGTQPEASIVVHPSAYDNTTNTEEGFVINEVPGT